jgi:hypothetical protein
MNIVRKLGNANLRTPKNNTNLRLETAINFYQLEYMELNMKKIIAFIVLSAFFSLHAYADWDYALEAKEAAEKKAQQEKEAKEKAKTDAILKKNDDQAKAEMAAQDKQTVASMRKDLGKKANGKSDAEVKKMWDAKVKTDTKNIQQQEAATRPMKDAQMKKMYGKDTKDLMNMSDEELEKFSSDMDKKYNH